MGRGAVEAELAADVRHGEVLRGAVAVGGGASEAPRRRRRTARRGPCTPWRRRLPPPECRRRGSRPGRRSPPSRLERDRRADRGGAEQIVPAAMAAACPAIGLRSGTAAWASPGSASNSARMPITGPLPLRQEATKAVGISATPAVTAKPALRSSPWSSAGAARFLIALLGKAPDRPGDRPDLRGAPVDPGEEAGRDPRAGLRRACPRRTAWRRTAG